MFLWDAECGIPCIFAVVGGDDHIAPRLSLHYLRADVGISRYTFTV
jgi:hypothetical protein